MYQPLSFEENAYKKDLHKKTKRYRNEQLYRVFTTFWILVFTAVIVFLIAMCIHKSSSERVSYLLVLLIPFLYVMGACLLVKNQKNQTRREENQNLKKGIVYAEIDKSLQEHIMKITAGFCRQSELEKGKEKIDFFVLITAEEFENIIKDGFIEIFYSKKCYVYVGARRIMYIITGEIKPQKIEVVDTGLILHSLNGDMTEKHRVVAESIRDPLLLTKILKDESMLNTYYAQFISPKNQLQEDFNNLGK